jgi:nitrite reductase (NADH) large subunit
VQTQIEKPGVNKVSNIVVVGNGPVGVHFAANILRNSDGANVVLYGDEPCDPYNRVQLSSYLVGESGRDSLRLTELDKFTHQLEKRYGCRVYRIDRGNRRVIDATGRAQQYDYLVLATGSRPHIPDIEGIDAEGVFTFRDMGDAQFLLKRRESAKHVVVIGGGLLGLEAAKAMQASGVSITVVEHNAYLMFNQLDEIAGEILLKHVREMGIHVCTADRITKVTGRECIESVQLGSGSVLPCDTLIVAAGIRSNTGLALNAGLKVNNGIIVNDSLQTNDPVVYAIGECAEHNGVVYGLAGPGLEQAKVLASLLTGKPAAYHGSVSVASLKVVGLPVFSIGRVGLAAGLRKAREFAFPGEKKNIYRKMVVHRDRLQGAVAIGDWHERDRILEALSSKRRIWPWQTRRFQRTGQVWSSAYDSVSQWPANAIVCNCRGVKRGALTRCVAKGCTTVASIARDTGASTVCGSCKPLLEQFLGGSAEIKPAFAFRSLAIIGVAAFVLVLATFTSPVIGYAATVQVSWQWDMLWRNSFAKQISGYTLLGLTLLISLLSLRKRWPPAGRIGEFGLWRLLHMAIGTLTLVSLALHTGFRLGNNLNFALMMVFSILILLGGLAGLAVAFEHKISASAGKFFRGQSTWLHILLFWPLPVLLGFHVLKTYYF